MRDTIRVRSRGIAARDRRTRLPPRTFDVPLLSLVVALLAVSIVGCGPTRPDLHDVSGEVYLDGKPVAGAGVIFCPEGGRPANAVTDDAGRFLLRTWHDADGALAGMHVVCVTKTVPTAAKTETAYPETKNVLPNRYASPATSPLRAEVVAGEYNHFRFDLAP